MWLANFLVFCYFTFYEGDFLSRFLLRVFFPSLRTLSAENLTRAEILRRVLLWCGAFLEWRLRYQLCVVLFVSVMTLLGH